MHITEADLRRLCPSARADIVAGIVQHAPDMLPRYGVTTPLRWCHLVAQLGHESAGFRTTVEYASGAAYEGRKDLGNTEPGDGARYKGRGLIQLTGRANYRRVGAELGLDLEGNPALAAEMPVALETALVYWRDRRINQFADYDDIELVTRRINGGLNGLADRIRLLVLAKGIWGAPIMPENIPNQFPATRPTLRLGSTGPAVATLQRMLNRGLPYRPPLVADGSFGPRTEVALIAWQGMAGLTADGVCGPETWASLDVASLGPPDVPDIPRPPEPPPPPVDDPMRGVDAASTPQSSTARPAPQGGFFHALLRRIFG